MSKLTNDVAAALFVSRKVEDDTFNRSNVAAIFYPADFLVTTPHEEATKILANDERITNLLKAAAETKTVEELEAVLAKAA